MATKHLLEEFPPVSTAAWEAAIARDLKGADYEKKLIWHSDEALAVKPYYRAEDLAGLACLDAAPGEFPYRRGSRTNGDWRIREEIDAENAAEANRLARAAVAAGAEEISFSGRMVDSSAALETLLANLGEVPVHLEPAGEKLLRLLIQRLDEQPHAAGISTGCDALASVEFAAELIRSAPAGFVPFTIHGELFEEAGATAVEEIGFALAAGIDFLAAMQEGGVDSARAATAIEFRFAVRSDYFIEIAKLRAFRMVWARAIEAFGGSCQAARITARTSRWNKTIYDPHVNILRATTEAMAAVLGGADSVAVAPFDACYKQPDAVSGRLARNTQLLLKHEAWLGRVADAGGGSYYLEALTDFLADEAWKRMQGIEALGGYRETKAQGAIDQALAHSMVLRGQAVATGRRVLTGTNRYANPAEHALDRVDVALMSAVNRGARKYEELRLRAERHAAVGGRVPRVLLAEIGSAKMRSARSKFAANFFACAGFEIATQRFENASEIAAADTDLIMLCSSDPEYAAMVAELMPKLRTIACPPPVMVAGNPENAQELASAGIADFVHLRSNAVELLTKWQERLGIELSEYRLEARS